MRHAFVPILATAFAACGDGTYTESVPPGSPPPPGSTGTFTDKAGRLYTVLQSSSGHVTLAVHSARDGGSIGSLSLGEVVPAGLAVDERGRAYLGDGSGSVHLIDPDGGFAATTFPAPDPRAATSWTDFNGASSLAVVSDTAATVTSAGYDPSQWVSLPLGGGVSAASFSHDGELLAISRTGTAGEIVVAQAGGLVSVAYAVPLVSPDGCLTAADDVAFARFGVASSQSWHALDLACGFLHVGGASQDTSATITLGVEPLPPRAGRRVVVDGWRDVAWISDGGGLKRVDLSTGGVTSVGSLSGTASVALANAGTLLWVARVTTGTMPVIEEVDGANTAMLASLGAPGELVRDLVYLDRPPSIDAPASVEAAGCNTGTATFSVSAFDPDDDPVDLFLEEGASGSFSGGTYSGTFYDDGWGPDGSVTFTVMSGYFLTHRTVDIYVRECESQSPPSDEDENESAGCICHCAVAAPARGSASGSIALLGAIVSSLARWRGRLRKRDFGCVLIALVGVAACGDEADRPSWHGGAYAVTASPESQLCGGSAVSFNGDFVTRARRGSRRHS